MKSKVIQLCDYKTIQIPDHYLSGRIPEEQIDRQLETLSANYAAEQEADTVKSGDSVACRSQSSMERWNRPLLLLYPGRGLCEPELENSCLDAKVGEQRTVELPEGEIILTVRRIVRRVNRPVDDELIKSEGIPGVETVEAYRRWYCDKTEKELKAEAVRRSSDYLIQEMISKSRYSIDEAERDEWCRDEANRQYDAMTAAGIDMTIPEEGTDFLTEEQARRKIYEEYVAGFSGYLAGAALLEQEGFHLETLFQSELTRFAKETNMTEEEMKERFNIHLVPTLLFFREGRVVHQCKGYMDRQALNHQIAKLLY